MALRSVVPIPRRSCCPRVRARLGLAPRAFRHGRPRGVAMMAGLKIAPLVAAVLAFAAVFLLRSGEGSPSDAAVTRSAPKPRAVEPASTAATPGDPLELASVP